MNIKANSSWYNEPWIWFNLIIFISAILGACIMTLIAIQHSPTEVDSRWYQEGPLIKQMRHVSMKNTSEFVHD